jgi:hypothetical protein
MGNDDILSKSERTFRRQNLILLTAILIILCYISNAVTINDDKKDLLISHINVAESTGNKMYIVYTLIDGVPQPEIMVPHDEALGRLVKYWEDEYDLVWLTGAVENNNPLPPVDKL